MKVAPLYHALKKEHWATPVIVHTGQHYDLNMSDNFFKNLGLPQPDIHLGVGSGTHADQTGRVMMSYEKVLYDHRPDLVVVVGDVNSTIACTLAASKIQYSLSTQHSTLNTNNRRRPIIAHVEAGLRSFDRTMPEEINRIVTDALCDLLFTPSEDADENLFREGISVDKIKRVGNIMIDTLVTQLDKARHCKSYDRFGLKPKNYVFVTLHRPSNVDNKASLSIIMECLIRLSENLPIVFPAHPRTRNNLMEFGLWEESNNSKKLILCEPLGYQETISLVDKARFVLTDSGGLQEETTFLRIPCLTLRPNTERPITITQGTNKLTSLGVLEQDFDYVLNGYHPAVRIPELWDGKTAERIVKILAKT